MPTQKQTPNTCAAVIAAAGSASRMEGIDKIFHPLNGHPLICRTMAAFDKLDFINNIILVAKETDFDKLSKLCEAVKKPVTIVAGGKTRAHSVLNGVYASKNSDFVAIHDGARPFITEELVTNVFNAAVKYGAAVPCLPVFDTVKQIENDKIVKTLDRSQLFLAQTPQIFGIELIKNALENAANAGLPITDDCAAVEALGVAVHMVLGDKGNIKITTKQDLRLS